MPNLIIQSVFKCNKLLKQMSLKERKMLFSRGSSLWSHCPPPAKGATWQGYCGSGTFLPSQRLIEGKTSVCIKYNKICTTKMLLLKCSSWNPPCSGLSAKLGKKQNSWLEPDKCFLESHFRLHLLLGNWVSEHGRFALHNPISRRWPLRSLWTFCPCKDIKAQKLTTSPLIQQQSSGPCKGHIWRGKDRLNGSAAKRLNADWILDFLAPNQRTFPK